MILSPVRFFLPRIARVFAPLLLGLALAPLGAHEGPHVAPGVDPAIAIDPNLGDLHHAVSTKNAQAQAFFDQGLRLVYAFNHDGAIGSFRRAAMLDPKLAIAHWGIAYASGPNINQPRSVDVNDASWEAMEKALALRAQASAVEREYIDALAKRYSPEPSADGAALDRAYADAMRELAKRHPEDPDAQVLFAESLLDLHPWKLWRSDGTPEEGTLEAIETLEKVLAAHPRHLGANHYFIHATEASPDPARALAAAARLEKLAPSAGHLVHMPAHVYIRTGDYAAAARANEAASLSDEKLLAAGVRSGYTVDYYGHNLHFLAVSYALAGNAAKSVAAARKLEGAMRARFEDYPSVDGYIATPAQVLVLFERWDDILKLVEPPAKARVSMAMYRFARAIAFAAKGQASESAAERELFRQFAPTSGASSTWGLNSAQDVLAVAGAWMDARIALLAGDAPAAIAAARIAAAAEEKLNYDEPPGWYLGSHGLLGRALLTSGDAAGAEQAFRAELRTNVESGRALAGLSAALTKQGRTEEAAQAGKRFDAAWRIADTRP
jgi:hypothetical protein